MTNNEHDQIDLELKEILGPLRNIDAGQARLDRWRRVTEQELATDRPAGPPVTAGAFRRRVVEWAVAASIGFALASGWMGFSQKESEAGDVSGFDATEIHLVAKSD